MADITEAEQFDTGVYQLETTDPVQGGVDGVDNIPHKALANRTVWLKAQVALKALLGGSATQLFKAKAGVASDDVVNKGQLDTVFSAAGNLSDIGTSLSEIGYMKLSNGLIIQWGTTGIIINNSVTDVFFPISFPNACLSAVTTPYTNGVVDYNDYFHKIMAISQTYLRVSAENTNPNQLYIAIGY